MEVIYLSNINKKKNRLPIRNRFFLYAAAFGILARVSDGVSAIPAATSTVIRNMVKASFTALEKLLETLPKLQKWFKADMPALIKGRLNDYAQSPDLVQYVGRLETDLGKMSSLQSWLATKGPDGLDSWRYLEEAFPDRIWCVP